MLAAIAALRKRGLPCYVATNQGTYRIAHMQAKIGYGQPFDRIFDSASIGAMKHDPAFYSAVTAALALPPDAILFWDDSAGNIAVARAYGWKAEHYTDFAAFQATMQQLLLATGD